MINTDSGWKRKREAREVPSRLVVFTGLLGLDAGGGARCDDHMMEGSERKRKERLVQGWFVIKIVRRQQAAMRWVGDGTMGDLHLGI